MYTSKNHSNKSRDDCDELAADWMTVFQLFLENYDNTQKSKPFLWPHYAERKIGELSNDWETKWEERQGSPQNELSRQHEAAVGTQHQHSSADPTHSGQGSLASNGR